METPEKVRDMGAILVVEDSRMIASFLRHQLTELGHQVDVAHSRADCAALLDKGQAEYFLAILDLNLPDAQEGEVVDLVLSKDIPSVVLTASLNASVRERVLSRGVIDYVLKSKNCVPQLIDVVKTLEVNSGRAVLVVDDSDFLRRVVCDYLKLYGYQVLQASNGKEAMEMVKAHPEVKLVVTDYEMPVMGGFELCRRLRAEYSKTELAIVGISSFKDELLSAKFIKSGANDFLSKPFQREELFCRVAQNLDTIAHIERINQSLQTISRLNESMTRDLEAAAGLQQSLLPYEPPGLDSVRVAAQFKPCAHLAGDTYNYFTVDDMFIFYVVDVSGHGVPSALLSFTLSRILVPPTGSHSPLFMRTEQGLKPRSPSSVLTTLNRQFPMNPETFQYFTMIYGVYDSTVGKLTYASAGHPGPVAVGSSVNGRVVGPCGLAVGFSPQAEYTDVEVAMQPGDRILFYTDGVVEAKNGSGEQYGQDRLATAFQVAGSEDVARVVQTVYVDVASFNKGPFKDDVTLLAFERIK